MKKPQPRQQCLGIDQVGLEVFKKHNRSIDFIAESQRLYTAYQQACRNHDEAAKQKILAERNALL